MQIRDLPLEIVAGGFFSINRKHLSGVCTKLQILLASNFKQTLILGYRRDLHLYHNLYTILLSI